MLETVKTASGLEVIIRDSQLEKEYKLAKQERSIVGVSENDLSHWPIGLAERFTRRIDIIKQWAPTDDGLWSSFDLKLVSSWVDGAGVDEFTKEEEPEFWNLKKAHKTWMGRFPNKMKLSDFDINIYSVLGKPIDVSGLWDLDDNGVRVRVDLYPAKGERGISI